MFDSVYCESLRKIFLVDECLGKLIFKVFYDNFLCSVIEDNKLCNWFSIISGER